MLLPNGWNLNQELVKHKQGWCWWYQKYAPGDTVLEGLETEAQERKKGLWTDPQPGTTVGMAKEEPLEQTEVALLYDRFTTGEGR